jgi:seryl-tRNA synthetase
LRLKGPERLWEFTMHEIVIVGSADQVEGRRRLLLEKATQLVRDLDLDAVVETANDPFFTNETMGRLVLQRLKALKFELKLATGDGRPDLAAASFNHHEDFFGTRFAIVDRSGKPAQSGCVAFGLERWAHAYVCRHGERKPP